MEKKENEIITLYIALCRQLSYSPTKKHQIWRSEWYPDGELCVEEKFLLGIDYKKGHQITYHIPIERWE